MVYFSFMSSFRLILQHINKWELFYQTLLHAVLFIFFAFDRHSPEIGWIHIAFFFNYALAAGLINYLLIPLFYNPKKYTAFFVFTCVLIAIVIGVEELILEKVFYSGTDRAKYTPNLFYCLLDVLPVIVMLVGFKFAWDTHQKQKSIDQLQKLIKDSELQVLKNQINPHFLFNNLNNLYALAIEKSPKTPSIILELSGVLRYMLYDCSEVYVSLSKELNHVQNYIELYKIQFEDDNRVQFINEGESGRWEIAPLILSTFIENAFKHSASSMTEDIKIDIRSTIESNGTLVFICENTYSQQSNVEQLGKGIGLKNVQKRLELLYPQKFKLNITTEQGVFKVELRMLLKESKL